MLVMDHIKYYEVKSFSFFLESNFLNYFESDFWLDIGHSSPYYHLLRIKATAIKRHTSYLCLYNNRAA